ncbi:extracellular solute-binding protein family 3 [Pseudodesulfovibrio mercurii]|uniref:Extracellular solute-binding protein family 3 n=1 Tax=Pseudodesulfovibrio mercurii TaxID=641491 RepID=F0JHC5_9BACT|nr:transporter substrate-binding domain-containing protein [Pseudodesulfovibrio mercurii]EGB15240.1 extracellular solute-binding protein family 3 [Pseudodesulfovibrio mercurii]
MFRLSVPLPALLAPLRPSLASAFAAMLLAVLAVLAVPGAVRAGGPVILVTDEYPPYVITRGERPGLLTEVVRAAFARVGVETEILYRPWRRCALMVREGEAFAAYPYGRTDARAAYALFSDPIWTCRNVFFYLKGRLGAFDFTSLDDLRGRLIAGTSGHYYEEIFKEKGLMVDYAPGEASGVRRLWELRATLFAEDELVGWTLINRIFPSQADRFASTPTPWNLNPQHLMVSRAYPGAEALLVRFDKGLAAIRGDGTYDRLVREYCGPAHRLLEGPGVKIP